jgi:hypothetical protein
VRLGPRRPSQLVNQVGRVPRRWAHDVGLRAAGRSPADEPHFDQTRDARAAPALDCRQQGPEQPRRKLRARAEVLTRRAKDRQRYGGGFFFEPGDESGPLKRPPAFLELSVHLAQELLRPKASPAACLGRFAQALEDELLQPPLGALALPVQPVEVVLVPGRGRRDGGSDFRRDAMPAVRQSP